MKRRKVTPVSPEWSYAIEADEIGPAPREVAIEAGAQERAALARRLGLVELSTLGARMTLRRSGRAIHITGDVEADVVQACVVTLAPIPAHVRDSFEAWYADPDAVLSFARARQEHERRTGQGDSPVLDESEDPEPIVDGLIDLGELAVQYLSLALDPYPRSPEAGLAAAAPEPAPPSDLRKSPFSTLKAWKFTKTGDEC